MIGTGAIGSVPLGSMTLTTNSAPAPLADDALIVIRRAE